jgi:hypothetical protein
LDDCAKAEEVMKTNQQQVNIKSFCLELNISETGKKLEAN